MGRVDAAAVRVRMVMKERPHLTSGSASGGGMSQEEQRAVEREREKSSIVEETFAMKKNLP